MFLPLSFRQYVGKKIKGNKWIAKVVSHLNYAKLLRSLQKLDTKKPIDFDRFNIAVYSQAGEDGILFLLTHILPVKGKYCVEFGVEDATECNTRLLIEKFNWQYLHMDGGNYSTTKTKIQKEFITAENINFLFEKYNVPNDLDILCVDIDYSTYYVLEAIHPRYRPSIIVVEYNASLGYTDSLVVKRQDDRMWDGSVYFGASLKALTLLLNERGYSLVYCDRKGISCYFILTSLTEIITIPHLNNLEKLYRKPQYGMRNEFGYKGHPPAKNGDIFLEIK